LEVIVDGRSNAGDYGGVALSEEPQSALWINGTLLLPWLAAGAVACMPFAFDTSPWDAVTLRVPGNQGNWWHFLVGVPFFLAYPMIWLRLRALFSSQSLTVSGRRLIWSLVGFSVVGTTLVELPFLLHLAGTRGWPRLSILSVGFGVLVASAVIQFVGRRRISPTQACLAGLDTAYLANAALCLVVYSDATGSAWSRSGWLVTMVIFWPIGFELIWIYIQAFRTHAAH
jgi:hypothetical protein